LNSFWIIVLFLMVRLGGGSPIGVWDHEVPAVGLPDFDFKISLEFEWC
jgi:hypothetical protein